MDWGSIASAFSGVGGSGVLGYWDGGWSTYSSAQSRTKYAANKAYEIQQKAAREMPSLTREGLERAGINPLLATSAFGSSSAGNPSFYDAPAGGGSLSIDGSKIFTAEEKKEIAKNDVEKGEETNDLIREQKENVKEQTRGQKIDNDLKGVKTVAGALSAVGALAGGSALAYKNLKGAPKSVVNDYGWDAVRGMSSVPASSKASRFGKGLLKSGIGMFLPAVVMEALESVKRGYDANKHDVKKLNRFVNQQFLGVH